MPKRKSQILWLPHYVSGVVTADWLSGGRNRRLNIDPVKLREVDSYNAADDVRRHCRSKTALSPERISAQGGPTSFAVAVLEKSFIGLAGIVSVDHVFGDVPGPRCVDKLGNEDLNWAELLCRGAVPRKKCPEIFQQVLGATFAILRLPVVQHSVADLASLIVNTSILSNTDGGLDRWLEARLHDRTPPWSSFMPMEEICREVSAEYAWLSDQDQGRRK